jgi:hypothetical protein
MGDVTLDIDRDSDSLMLSILGVIIKGKGFTHMSRELPEAADHRFPGLYCSLSFELRQQEEPALSLGKTVERHRTLPGYETVSLPVAIISSRFN